MKALLTSTGFDNQNILKAFLNLLDVPCNKVKALFIPTALSSQGAKEYIHVFMADLLVAGIRKENILSYDLNRPFSCKKSLEFGVV